ncbi:MAG: ABC transporter substrate-binding protein, partial [Verrucomicrobiota bacterium]
SDGEPLDADDVIFTFDAIYDERYANRYAYSYQQDGQPFTYEKLDSYTVRFTTPDIFAPFMNTIGWADILPEHILREAFDNGTLLEQFSTKTAQETPELLVGTGPFVLESYQPGERMVFAPNPHYWRADRAGNRLPYIDHFIWRFVDNMNARKINFFTGQTDSLDPIGASDIAWLEENAPLWDYTLHDQGPDTSIQFFWFNQNRDLNEDGEPYQDPIKLAWFTDRNFRQAVITALNREGIANGPYQTKATPLHSVITPGNPHWYYPEVPKYAYDPQKARALLRESGFSWDAEDQLLDKDGNPVVFTILGVAGGSARYESLVTTIRQNLRDIGMQVDLSLIDFNTLIRKTDTTQDYDAALLAFTGGGDPAGGKSLYLSSGKHHMWHPEQKEPATEWEARIDAIIAEQERTLDQDRRKELFNELQVIFSREVPLIYLLNPQAFCGMKNKWQNQQILFAAIPPYWNIDELWSLEFAPDDKVSPALAQTAP